MAIQRWDPVRDLLQLQERMNRLIEDVLARSGAAREPESLAASGWRPAMDLLELADRYLVRIDLPGVSSGGVEIEIEGDHLVVRGERRFDPSVPREAYLRTERPQGRFALQVSLPPDVDRSAVEAHHEEGVLEIRIPKKREERPSRVKVDVR